MSIDIVTQLRSPEKVLHSIAASARIEGMAAPRRISFDEPRPGEPLAVLSLTWTSLADMRPWLPYFAADKVYPYVRPDGSAHHTAYAEFGGWQVSLNAVDSVRCDCGATETHMLGCAAMSYPVDPVITGTPAEVLAHLADHYGREANRDEAERLGAEHHTLTIAEVTDEPRDVAIEFSHHRGLSDTYKVRIDVAGRAWILDNHRWVKVGEVALSHLGVAEIDAHCCAENYLKAQPTPLPRRIPGATFDTEPAPVAFSDAQRVQAEAWRAAVCDV